MMVPNFCILIVICCWLSQEQPARKDLDFLKFLWLISLVISYKVNKV